MPKIRFNPAIREATALTDLRPAGKVRVDGKRVDGVSEGGFLRAGTPLTIVTWRAGAVVVRPRAAAAGVGAHAGSDAEGGESS